MSASPTAGDNALPAKSIDAAHEWQHAESIPAALTWRVVGICLFMIFVEGYDVGIYGAVLPTLTHGTGWVLSELQLGAIASCSLAGMMIGAMGAGTLSDLLGRRTMLLASVGLFSLMMGAAALAPSPGWFAAFRVIGGLGLGGVIPTAAALTVEYSPPARRSFNYALIYTGYSIGGVLVALVAMFWLPVHGWRLLFGIGAVPSIALPFVARCVPESLQFLLAQRRFGEARETAARFGITRLNVDAIGDGGGGSPQNTAPRGIQPVRALFEPSHLRATLAFWLAMFMGLLLLYGLSTWLPQLMRKSGFPLGSSLSLLLTLNVTAAVGSLAGGAVADRFGSKVVVSTLYLLAGASLCALAGAHGQIETYVLVGIAGLGSIGNTMLLGAYITRYYPPHNRATGIGWALGVGRFGAIAGPLIGGALAQSHAPLPWNFHVFAVAGVLAAGAVCLVPARGDGRL